jgi:hypothetical protein
MQQQNSNNPFNAPMPATTTTGHDVDPNAFLNSLKVMNPD